MIKAAICDDDGNARAYLSKLILAQPAPCEVMEYASAEACLADGQAADLYFLDVELDPGKPDGMALAQSIRERAPRAVIIFVTGYGRYVFDAFDVGAFHYLLKPVDEARFAQVFARAAAQAESARTSKVRTLTFRSASTSRTVRLDSIYYIESCNHKVVLHLTDGAFTCYGKIRDLEAELQDQFFRIHKGYLVNLAYVGGYSKTEVSLTNGEALLLSKYKYQEFMKTYLRFLKKGAGL